MAKNVEFGACYCPWATVSDYYGAHSLIQTISTTRKETSVAKRKKHKLYCYALANQMVGHRFTDDVAICWAMDKAEAIERFQKLYALADESNVFEVRYGSDKVAILTDY